MSHSACRGSRLTASVSRVLVIVGPTASGKSAVAEAIADTIDSEIVSADSMQVYRGMDIATDKPDEAARRRYRYRLIDVADPSDQFTVVGFRELARAAIADAEQAGHLPVLVGGSGLYVRAVIDDLEFPRPACPQPVVREQLESLASSELVDRLRVLDPEAARTIHPNNKRRLVRALEFIGETGTPFSGMQKQWSQRNSIYDLRMFGLAKSRGALYDAVNARVDAMIAAGLVEEAEKFVRRAAPGHGTAGQVLGYKELAAYLAGEESLEEGVARLKAATRRFAKRQMTWFRRDPRIVWMRADATSADRVAARIINGLRNEGWLHLTTSGAGASA